MQNKTNDELKKILAENEKLKHDNAILLESQSADLWAKFHNSLSKPALYLNSNMIITNANHAFVSAIKKERSQIIGKPCFEVFYGCDKSCAKIDCPVKELKNNNALKYVERELEIFEGHYIVSCSSVYNALGQFEGITYTATCIDFQKEIIEKLRESEERWQFAIEGSNEGVWDWDMQSNKAYFSNKWKTMLGFSQNEVGNSLDEWKSRVHPDDLDCCLHDLDRHFKGETPHYVNEHRMLCKDGSYKWILDRGKVITRNAEGHPLRVIGTHSDISERKKVEVLLHEQNNELEAQNEEYMALNEELSEAYERISLSESRYRLLVENMQLGLALHEVVCNNIGEVVDYVFLEINNSYEKLTGLKKENVIGKKVTEVLPGVEKYWIENFGKVALTGEVLHYENFVEVLGKHYETLAYRPSPYKFAVIVSDISDRKKAEELLKLKNEEMEAQNEVYLQLNEELSQVNEELKLINEELFVSRQKIEESENMLDDIINTQPFGVYRLKANPNSVKAHTVEVAFEFANKYFCEICGVERNELFDSAANFIKRIHPSDYKDFIEKNRIAEINNARFVWEGRLIVNQNILWVHLESVPRSLKNKSTLWTGVLIDISERKRLEDSLQKRIVALTQPLAGNSPISFSELFDINEIQRLQDAFANATGVSSIITNPDGSPITQPSRFCTLCQLIRATEKGKQNCYKSDAAIGQHNEEGPVIKHCLSGGLWDAGASITVGGKHIANWLVGQIRDNSQDNEKMLAYAKEIGIDERAFEKALNEVPQMSYQRFESVSKALFVFANELSEKAYQNVLQARFIDDANQRKEELKMVISELEKARTKAEEADRLKTAFLANMSHEIRTPMNGILGFADLLKNPSLTGEKQQQYISVIEQSGNRMLSIINDIIDISKIEAGQTEIVLEKVDILALLNEVYLFFMPEADKKGLALSLKKPEKDAPIILTDGTKLNQIIVNLVKNAVKFTFEGQIDIGCEISEKFILFTISDTGLGIEQSIQDAVFERFRQGSNELSRPYEGSGLGLAIAKAYTHLLGGNIWLESAPGKGSKFFVEIPCNPANELNFEKKQKPAAITAISEKITILVAEDDETNLYYMLEVLEGICAETLIAADGAEAVNLVKANPQIQVVLMDIKMPVMDGLEATRQIKALRPELPVLAITAYALDEDCEKAHNAGCAGYLSKPVKGSDLIALIKKHTE